MLDKETVARRPLDFEDYIDILRRNVSWIIGPVFAGLVIATVVAFFLEDTFVSIARIRVVPQQISDTIVQSTTAQDMLGRIDSMAQTIRSTTNLKNVITNYGLYKDELKHEPIDDVIATKMLPAIAIGPIGMPAQTKGASTMMGIQFKYHDRNLARQICADFVNTLMNSSSVDTQNSQTQANEFLKAQAAKSKAELDEAEQKLSDFRAKHAGALPDEMQSNFQQMSVTQQRVNALSDQATRVSQSRLMLNSALQSAKDRLASLRQMTPVSIARSERNSELDRQISELETNIASMKDQFTAEYPDLQAAQERLAVLRRQRDEASKAPAKTASDGDNPVLARERLDAQAQIDQIQGQLKALAMEDTNITKQLALANGQLGTFSSRLVNAPAGEQEYSELLSSVAVARQKFVEADGKAHKSDVSKDLETAKQGETLEVVDQASLPIEPTEPKRYLIIPIGAVAGLIIGIILVAIREVRDTSLKSLKDARVYTQLAILGSIPLLENDVVVQRRKQVMVVSWLIATVVGLAIIGGSAARYYTNLAK